MEKGLVEKLKGISSKRRYIQETSHLLPKIARDPGLSFFQGTHVAGETDLPFFDGVTDRLEIAEQHLSKGQCEAVAAAMATDRGSRISEIVLIDNGLSDEELTTLLAGVQALDHNTHLCIKRNQIGNLATSAICQQLMINKPPTHLRHLELNYQISADGFAALTRTMAVKCFLETFRVQNAFIGAKGVENLKQMLSNKKCTILKNFDIAWCKFQGCVQTLAREVFEAVATNRRLQDISVAWVQLVYERKFQANKGAPKEKDLAYDEKLHELF